MDISPLSAGHSLVLCLLSGMTTVEHHFHCSERGVGQKREDVRNISKHYYLDKEQDKFS